MCSRPHHQTTVLDHTNDLVAEWAEILKAMLQKSSGRPSQIIIMQVIITTNRGPT